MKWYDIKQYLGYLLVVAAAADIIQSRFTGFNVYEKIPYIAPFFQEQGDLPRNEILGYMADAFIFSVGLYMHYSGLEKKLHEELKRNLP